MLNAFNQLILISVCFKKEIHLEFHLLCCYEQKTRDRKQATEQKLEITHDKRRTSQGEIFQRQKTATHDKHVGASKKKSTQRTLKDIYPTFNAFEF